MFPFKLFQTGVLLSSIPRFSTINNTPVMTNLPNCRTTPLPPFSSVDIDFAGSLTIKESRGWGYKTTKCYICLFICFAINVIHVKLVTSLSSNAF